MFYFENIFLSEFLYSVYFAPFIYPTLDIPTVLYYVRSVGLHVAPSGLVYLMLLAECLGSTPFSWLCI